MSTLTKVCLPLCFIILLVQSAVIGYYCHSNIQMVLLTIVSIIEVFMFSTLMPRGELHDAAETATMWDTEMGDLIGLASLRAAFESLDQHEWQDGYLIVDNPDYSDLSDLQKIGMSQDDFL